MAKTWPDSFTGSNPVGATSKEINKKACPSGASTFFVLRREPASRFRPLVALECWTAFGPSRRLFIGMADSENRRLIEGACHDLERER